MAIQAYVCQGGCGNFEEDVSKLHSRGMVTPKLYCSACVHRADEYIEERDKIHTRLAKEWEDGLMYLASDFSGVLKVLPDG